MILLTWIFLFSQSLFMTGAHAAEVNDAKRPDEGELFGEQPGDQTQALSKKSELGLRDAFATGEVKENPLQIGGTYYQQFIFSAQDGVSVKNTPMTAPMQFDGYLDGRPNDRLRAFVDARLIYDPTRDQYSNSTNSNSFSVQGLQTQSTTSSGSMFSTTLTPNNPTVVLDQAWLAFDFDRTVFVTAGKQHLKWGASRFWNPTDFLNTQRRNPLLPYDLRLGNNMIKFELPLERRKTNLCAVALLDNPQPASSLGQVGGALRAESLFGNLEVGLDFIARGGDSPIYGGDFSTALGLFDIYGEAAIVSGSRVRYQSTSLAPAQDISTAFNRESVAGPSLQVSSGARRDFAWREDRQATLGIEYFYNQLGYSDSSAYPALILTGNYQPFYTGRNYAAIYLTAEGADADKHSSYGFSTLANLSDHSLISRADLTWRLLTYLTFDGYVDAHTGLRGGEFNFSLSTPVLTNQSVPIPAINVPATFFDLGFSLRMSI